VQKLVKQTEPFFHTLRFNMKIVCSAHLLICLFKYDLVVKRIMTTFILILFVDE